MDTKFDEVLARLPQPPPASTTPSQQHQQPPPRHDPTGRVPRVLEPGKTFGATATSVYASVTPIATVEVEDYYEDEVDQNQNYVQPPPPPGHPHACYTTTSGTRS